MSAVVAVGAWGGASVALGCAATEMALAFTMAGVRAEELGAGVALVGLSAGLVLMARLILKEGR